MLRTATGTLRRASAADVHETNAGDRQAGYVLTVPGIVVMPPSCGPRLHEGDLKGTQYEVLRQHRPGSTPEQDARDQRDVVDQPAELDRRLRQPPRRRSGTVEPLFVPWHDAGDLADLTTRACSRGQQPSHGLQEFGLQTRQRRSHAQRTLGECVPSDTQRGRGRRRWRRRWRARCDGTPASAREHTQHQVNHRWEHPASGSGRRWQTLETWRGCRPRQRCHEPERP